MTQFDTIESVDDLDQVWEGPASQPVDAVTQEIFALCLAAQERVDATAEREAVSDLPWIPAEMKEVVRVTFGCPES